MNTNRIVGVQTTLRIIILNKLLPIFILITTLLLVNACGQSGDLYMPEPPAEEQTN